MKVVGHKSSIVRWIAKLVSHQPKQPSNSGARTHTLDDEQLRQVAGGNGSTQTPYKGW